MTLSDKPENRRMVPSQRLVGFRRTTSLNSMAENPPTPADSLVCPFCGHSQNRAKVACLRCGAPMNGPGLIHRKLPDGRWSIVRDIDLSSLAPKPVRPPRKWFTQQGVLIIAIASVLMGLLLWFAWKKRDAGREAETHEVAQYLRHPVGRIVPWFQLRGLKSAEGSLRLVGQCNLPTGTQLDARILSGGVLVAVDYPVTVSAGSFTTRALLARGRPFEAGTYRAQIKADFGERWQPASVLLVVGNLGERLEGPLVERRESSSEAGLIYTEDFTLN
jgi:hypothetical protein